MKKQMGKRFVIFALLMLFCVGSVCGCAESAVHEGFYEADTQNADFSMYIPNDWDTTYTEAVVTASSKDHSASISMMVAANPTASSGDEPKHPIDLYWESYEDTFRSTFPDLEYTVKGEETTLGGEPAKRYEYKATVAGTPYRFEQIVSVKGTLLSGAQMYIFTFAALDEQYDTYYNTIQECISYVKLK